MAGVPYVFGNATTSIPLTNLDANFNTGLTIGNTTVGLGNTVTTLGNVTLTNVNIISGTVPVATSIANGTSNVSVVSSGGNIAMSTNGTQQLFINTTGAVVLQGGTQAATGVGIAFPANQSASSDVNTLDDYEEGTWTPTDGSGAGRTFTNLLSTYTKVGRQVTVIGYFVVDISANASTFKVNGLPFSTTASSQNIGTFNSSSGSSGTSVINPSTSSVLVGTLTTYNTLLINSQISNAGCSFTLTYFI